MTKDHAIAKAKHDASIHNHPMAVLNLNRYSPLYVVRFWDTAFMGVDGLAFVANPANTEPAS